MKTIFITGGASGIGAAAVAKFLNKGWNVAFADVQSPDVVPEGTLFFKVDTRNAEALRQAVSETVSTFAGLHAVFANAGIHRKNTLLDISDAELREMVEINVIGTVNTLKATVPALRDSGGGAVVVNASDQVFIGKAASFGYGLTKGALGQLVKSCAIDFAPMGIRINAVCPATIHTPLVDRIFDRLSTRTGIPVEEYLREEAALFAPNRMGTPAEVANMVYFLCSDEAAFCTGANYLIDGGLVNS